MTRRGLIIGCGGTIGGAWIIAALNSLEQQLNWDARDAYLLQGTSAGAEMVTMLAGGISVRELVAMQRGSGDNQILRDHLAHTPKTLPPVPMPIPLSVSNFRRAHGLAALAGLAPTGRGNAQWLDSLAAQCSPANSWWPREHVRLVSYDLVRSERVVYGSKEAPAATVSEALRASWAIPGWMAPVVIDGRRHIDGGAASTASVDLAIGTEMDEAIVIVPMASRVDTPIEAKIPGLGGRLENAALRRPFSATLRKEVQLLRESGVKVAVIEPRAHDLAGLPANFMSKNRRAAAFEWSMSTVGSAVSAGLKASNISGNTKGR